jgi:hypothetical protein
MYNRNLHGNSCVNKKLVATNIERNAILTKQQKIHLKSKKVDPKILNNIRRTLEKKLDGLTEDLDMIKNSKSLESWRLLQFKKFQDLHKVLEDTVMNFKPVYPYAVKIFTRKVGKQKFHMFWMDLSEESNFSTERIFEPSFALRKIKHYLNDDSFELLCWAVENNLIPYYKKNAKREEDFKLAKNDESRISELQNTRTFTNENKAQPKPEIEKERLENKKMWNYINKQYHMLNKKLHKKYGVKAIPKIEKFDVSTLS